MPENVLTKNWYNGENAIGNRFDFVILLFGVPFYLKRDIAQKVV